MRHGHYYRGPDVSEEQQGKVTPLGEKQAKWTGQWLAQFPITVIHSSSIERAVMTARIVNQELKVAQLEISEQLWECHPIKTMKLKKRIGYPLLDSFHKHRRYAKKAFKEYIKIDPEQTEDTFEVIVSHGNLIRYIACRSIGIRSEAWYDMGMKQCGISVIEVHSEGRIILDSHNLTGHIPLESQTIF